MLGGDIKGNFKLRKLIFHHESLDRVMRATFYGIGYVGLVQAAVLADAGHEVCCVDIDQEKVEERV